MGDILQFSSSRGRAVYRPWCCSYLGAWPWSRSTCSLHFRT